MRCSRSTTCPHVPLQLIDGIEAAGRGELQRGAERIARGQAEERAAIPVQEIQCGSFAEAISCGTRFLRLPRESSGSRTYSRLRSEGEPDAQRLVDSLDVRFVADADLAGDGQARNAGDLVHHHL